MYFSFVGKILAEILVKHVFLKDFIEKDAIVGTSYSDLDEIIAKHLIIFRLNIRQAVIGISLTSDLIGAPNPWYSITNHKSLQLMYECVGYGILSWWHKDISTVNRLFLFVACRKKSDKTLIMKSNGSCNRNCRYKYLSAVYSAMMRQMLMTVCIAFCMD